MKRIIALGIVAVMACVLASTASAQIMIGNMNNNVIQGTPNDDLIRAYGGNDTVAGGGGTDVIYLGTGNDYVKVCSLDENGKDEGGDRVFGRHGIDHAVIGHGDTARGFEYVRYCD